MRAIPMAVAVAVLCCGCHHWSTPGSTPDADGVACGAAGAGDRVYVTIRYGAGGTPSAHPDECTVEPGTWITWRGPVDSHESFGLAFPNGSPGGRGEPDSVRSAASGDRERVSIRAGNGTGRYKYDLEANGITVDPAIIIKRTN